MSSLANARTRYLDLMEKILTNTIYEDPAGDPWFQGSYDSQRRSIGQDWPMVAHTMLGQQRLHNLRVACERVIQEEIPGDFIETGIWRGGACILMRAVLAAYEDTSRTVFCADSFEGLPAPDPEKYPADRGDVHHTYAPLQVTLEQVQSHFAKYGLLDDQVQFLKGWFKDTLPTAPIERLAILRLDGDMYQSTMEGLDALYPKLMPGGFCIVDDYGAVAACRQAVEDYFCRGNDNREVHRIDWTGVYWRKEVAELTLDLNDELHQRQAG